MLSLKNKHIWWASQKYEYRTRAIISRGLYTFYPLFEDNFFIFKDVFLENSILMYG